MKRIFKYFAFIIVLFLSSCGVKFDINSLPTNEVVTNELKGEIGSFDLLGPCGKEELISVPTFSWEKAKNADHYTFELASTIDFETHDVAYIKKSGLTSTSLTLTSSLKYKEKEYFYRVTAYNSNSKRKANQEYESFYLKANTDEEITFDIEYADEWVCHELGSKADISIDNSNFFNNDKKSLVINFEEEDTNKGDPESDGWIVVTHNQEEEMYGVDAFYFNFYYSGQSSSIWLRCVDEDNEYYNAEIKVANNVKQTIIMKFSDFTLRTKGGTTIANQVFDYNYIKSVELVFEQTFGDGICLLSDLKAVSFEKYSHLFINHLDFNEVNKNEIATDNYAFNYSFSDDGSDVSVSFNGDINGYGFVKIPVEKHLVTSDAIKFNIEYTGDVSSRILLRIIEEDKDSWVYRQECRTIPSDNTLIIPYKAFTLSEYNGNGSREFYYLKTLQIGIENAYSRGSIKLSNIEFINLEDYINDLYISSINNEGVIDNFESYNNTSEIYYKWIVGTANKDEVMILNKDMAFGSNNKCVKLGYKTDMYPAYYGLRFNNFVENKNAISIDFNDASIKFEDAKFNHINDVSAKAIVSLYVESGEEYVYVIDSLNKFWSRYVLSFNDFILSTPITSETMPLNSENIIGLKIGLQYYYYLANGVSYPLYANNNYVYMDNLKFINANNTNIASLAKEVSPSLDNANVSLIEDFEAYDNSSLYDYWIDQKPTEYSGFSLSDDTSTLTGKSLKMKYQGNQASVSYGSSFKMNENVKGKGFIIDLKGDDVCTIYINIFVTYSGTNFKFRASLNNVASSWKRYTIGFDNFSKIEGSGNIVLSSSIANKINKITFGLVNYSNNNVSYCYCDNIKLDYGVSYSTLSSVAL